MDMDDVIQNNPWWKGMEEIYADQSVRELREALVPWTPELKGTFDTSSDRIYVIRGPRQVGKTTLMKMFILELLEQEPRIPKRVFYFTCDIIKDHQELVETIRLYMDFSSEIKGQRRYMFIDEICQVNGWEKGIKYMADTGMLVNTTIFLTGSHSMDLKYSSERLPGRRGEGKGTLNKTMLPMSFREYVKTIEPDMREKLGELYRTDGKTRVDMILNMYNGELKEDMVREYQLYKKELGKLFDSYLLTGGIIRAANQHFRDQHIEDSAYEIYVRSLIGDLARWNHGEKIAKQVLRSIITKMTTGISLNSIATENEIGSHNTVSSYLEALEDAMVINTVHKLDMNKMRPMTRSDRKIYLTDPFIYHSIENWTHGRTDYYRRSLDVLLNSEKKSRLVEMVVASHLARLSYNMEPSDVFSPHERLYYWKKKGSEKEVDFVLKHNNKLFPVEVKYRNNIKRSDLSALYNFRKGVIISKNTLETHNQYTTIPVEAFLLLI